MLKHDFDLGSLCDALDLRRRQRNMSWSAVAGEISRSPGKRAVGGQHGAALP
jgi:hypothetical protein